MTVALVHRPHGGVDCPGFAASTEGRRRPPITGLQGGAFETGFPRLPDPSPEPRRNSDRDGVPDQFPPTALSVLGVAVGVCPTNGESLHLLGVLDRRDHDPMPQITTWP